MLFLTALAYPVGSWAIFTNFVFHECFNTASRIPIHTGVENHLNAKFRKRPWLPMMGGTIMCYLSVEGGYISMITGAIAH